MVRGNFARDAFEDIGYPQAEGLMRAETVTRWAVGAGQFGVQHLQAAIYTPEGEPCLIGDDEAVCGADAGYIDAAVAAETEIVATVAAMLDPQFIDGATQGFLIHRITGERAVTAANRPAWIQGAAARFRRLMDVQPARAYGNGYQLAALTVAIDADGEARVAEQLIPLKSWEEIEPDVAALLAAANGGLQAAVIVRADAR